MKKFDQYVSHLRILSRAFDEDLTNDFIVSGIIDKYYIQFELGWKVLKELLRYEGANQAATGSPREIIKTPDILLCDEPTGALDYRTSKEILKLIETVNRKYGYTIIMVTHNDAIKDMADRVVKLRDGMIRKNYRNEHKLTAAELEW